MWLGTLSSETFVKINMKMGLRVQRGGILYSNWKFTSLSWRSRYLLLFFWSFRCAAKSSGTPVRVFMSACGGGL